jgi:hypothetical protein
VKHLKAPLSYQIANKKVQLTVRVLARFESFVKYQRIGVSLDKRKLLMDWAALIVAANLN